MNMDSMYRLEEMCCRELDKIIERGELSSSALQQAHMLTDTVKNVYKIEMLCGGEGEYSRDGGSSYANRGQHYVRGHYSRDGGNGGGSYGRNGGGYSRDSYGRYSRDGGRDDMVQRLEQMMEQTNNPNERDAYKRALEQLKNM